MPILKISPPQQAQSYGNPRMADNYQLFAMPKSKPLLIDLGGSKLTNLSWEEDDGRTRTVPQERRGAFVEVTENLRGKRIVGVTGDMTMPPGKWTPLDAMRDTCYTLLAKHTCPDGLCDDEYVVFVNTTIHEPRLMDKLVGFGDDGGYIERMASMSAMKAILQPGFGRSVKRSVDVSGKDVLSLREPASRCVNCSNTGYKRLYRGGGDVTTPILEYSDNGFQTSTALNTGIAGANYITDIYADGNFICVTYSTVSSVTGSFGTATGGIQTSLDGGATWQAGTSGGSAVTNAMQAIRNVNGLLIAVGKGAVLSSPNGLNWTAMPLPPSVNAATILTGLDYDPASQQGVIVGRYNANGVAMTVRGNVVRDISSTLAVTGQLLYSVHVASPGHVLIGGASGVLQENLDFSANPDTWHTSTIGSAAIRSITGPSHAVFMVAGTTLYQRSPFTNMDFTAVSITNSNQLQVVYASVNDDTGAVDRVYSGTASINSELFIVETCTPNLDAILNEF